MIMNWVPGLTLEAMEKMAIQQAMQYFRGNKTATASALGVAVRTLDNKLEIYAEEEKRMKAVQDERIKQQREFFDRSRGVNPAVLDGAAKKETKAAAPVINTGVQVEPTPEVSAQLSLSVPEREQVQAVLPEQAAPSGKRRGRPPLHRTDET